MLTHAWIIPLLMALSFLLILSFGKRLPKGGAEIGIAAVGLCFVLALATGVGWVQRTNHPPEVAHSEEAAAHGEEASADDHADEEATATEAEAEVATEDEAPAEEATATEAAAAEEDGHGEEAAAAEGEAHAEEEEHHVGAPGGPQRHLVRRPAATTITVGTLVDGLSAMMLVVVTLISLLVHVYSTDYVAGDRRYTHYFAFLPPVHRLDAVLRADREHAADDRGLGAGRPLLVRADRPLVGGEAELRRRPQGLPHQPRGRRRPARRHDHPVLRRRRAPSTSSTSTPWPTTGQISHPLLLVVVAVPDHRGDVEVGPVHPAHLAARRHGRPDARCRP